MDHDEVGGCGSWGRNNSTTINFICWGSIYDAMVPKWQRTRDTRYCPMREVPQGTTWQTNAMRDNAMRGEGMHWPSLRQRGLKLKMKGVWGEVEMNGGTRGTIQWGRYHKGQCNHQCTNMTREDAYRDARASFICWISTQQTNVTRDDASFPVTLQRNGIQGGMVMAWDWPTGQTQTQQ